MNIYEVKTADGSGFLVGGNDMIEAAKAADARKFTGEEIVSIIKLGKNGM